MQIKRQAIAPALLAVLAAAGLHPGTASAQPVTGLYVGAGVGANFMQDETVGFSGRQGAFTSTSRFFGTSTYPATSYSNHGSIGLDPGGVAVASLGYGFGNGLRAEIEGDYRINGFSGSRGYRNRGYEEKFGGMLNVLYDLPVQVLGATPYAGLGAGYMWANRDHSYDRTDSFAYQAILGASLPIPAVPGLSATLEYRFMGLAGADHKSTYPGYSYASPTFSYTQAAGSSTSKFSDDFNHSILIGLRYAFNAAPPPVVAPMLPPAQQTSARTYLVFFDWDRADLTDRARQIIAEAAQATTRVAVTRIEVNGYTDTSGTPRYNQGLSVRRAQNVAAELVKDGVPRAAIATQGFGERNLLVQTGQGVREPQNRRVEIVLR